ncbi:acyltransferase family protein [Paenibacillus provencensis]|uniref:Acyltransferase family protein n=1 Tax=Paenibacillus provencensis TaxID=441151 RepID=A0ABW3PYM1_9BACL|nr:acyltransferase [Paenibacillus sp. MER 78]MCM3127705.1 acyltransferase [Paenibacillus sp. MER 78]
MKLKNISNIKGVLIILVVFGHCFPLISRNEPIVNYIWTFIYNFHMPPFFLLSGLLYYNSSKIKKISGKKFVLGKLKTLMIPYLTVSLCSYLLIYFLSSVPLFNNLLSRAGYGEIKFNEMIYSIITNNNHIDQHLWFVYALFLIFLFQVFLDKATDNHILKFILTLGISLLGSFIFTQGLVSKVFYFSFYFYIGRYFLNNWNNFSNITLKTSLINIVMFFGTNSLLTYLSIANLGTSVLTEIMQYFVAIHSIFALISLIRLLRGIQLLERLSQLLGNNSFIIYLLHQPFLVSGVSGVIILMNQNIILYSPFITVLGIMVPIIIYNFLIKKNNIISFLFTGKATKPSKSIDSTKKSININ